MSGAGDGWESVPSNVQIFEIVGSVATFFFEVSIMASELSIPWILPFPVASVLAIWILIMPSVKLLVNSMD